MRRLLQPKKARHEAENAASWRVIRLPFRCISVMVRGTAIAFKLLGFVLLDFLLVFQPGDLLFSPLDFLVNGLVVHYQFLQSKWRQGAYPCRVVVWV